MVLPPWPSSCNNNSQSFNARWEPVDLAKEVPALPSLKKVDFIVVDALQQQECVPRHTMQESP